MQIFFYFHRNSVKINGRCAVWPEVEKCSSTATISETTPLGSTQSSTTKEPTDKVTTQSSSVQTTSTSGQTDSSSPATVPMAPEYSTTSSSVALSTIESASSTVADVSLYFMIILLLV